MASNDVPDEQMMRSTPEVDVTWGVGLHAPVRDRVDESAYELYIGRWSRLFVPTLINEAGLGAGDRVLDVATGTGVTAPPLLSTVGPHGLVVATDISPGMLRAAAVRTQCAGFRLVVADAQSLPFAPGSFDAVVCQLGLMFFQDSGSVLEGFRRALRPGGRSAVCVISTAQRAPMWGALAGALSGYLPNDKDTLNLSFSLSSPAVLEQLFLGAGFRDVRVTAETRFGTVGSFDEYWTPIEAGTGSLPQAYLALSAPDRLAVKAAVREGLSAFDDHGQYALTVEMLIGSGAN